MKSAGTISLAVALLLTAAARAQDPSDAATAAAAADKPGAAAPVAEPDAAAAADKPYASIVARNMFGLLPIPPAAPVDEKPPVDVPKITPNGIITIFGRKEALFKVPVKPKPGQPPKDQSYVLGEGEMQDEITVVKINDAESIVTFNNHGTIQELPLVVAANTSGPGPGGGPGGPGNPFAGGRSGVSPAAHGRAAGRVPIPAPTAQANPGMNMNSSPTAPNTSFAQPTGSKPANIEDQVMSAAKEMAQIELNRIATQELVDQGKLPPLPPTLLTPADATAHDGAPLIVPNEPVQQNIPPPRRH